MSSSCGRPPQLIVENDDVNIDDVDACLHLEDDDHSFISAL